MALGTPPYAWRAPVRITDSFWLLGSAVGALLLSLIFPLSAFEYGPFVLPAVLLAVVLLSASLARPEIGIAAALVMVPLGNFGLLDLGLVEWPPWLPVALWVTFVFVISVLRVWGRDEGFPRMGGALIVYLGVIALSFGIADSQTDALPVLRSVTVGVLLFFATALSVRDRRGALLVVRGIALTALLVGAIATYEQWSGASQEGFVTTSGEIVDRAVAGLHHPNELGGFLVLLVPFILAGALIQRRGRVLFLLALIFALLGIYASFSRGAMIALVAIPFFFISRRQVMFLLPAFIALILIATPGLVRERFASLTTGGDEAVTTRTDIWRAANDIWSRNPITGAGAGSFPKEYSEARIPGKQFLPNSLIQPPPHAHNLFLQHLAETGLLGLIALLAILALALRTSLVVRRSSRRWARLMGSASLASLAAFLMHNLVDLTLIEGTGMYFWGLLGLLAGLSAIVDAEETADPTRVA
jgi:O-antigen ligase